jgi:transcriptional regulator with XRE-family HTH domain
MTVMSVRPATSGVGELLREWRQRRHLSQLDLAIEADISARHLSFVETGRSKPTSAMILRLSEQLEVPLRNTLLLAGGYAPCYPEHGLDEPELAAVRAGLRRILDGHDPYPAVLVNRQWELIDQNASVSTFTDGVASSLLEPPVNVLRLSLHPDGMAPRIANLAEWRAHLLTRLHRQAAATADARLAALHEELRGYAGGESEPPHVTDVIVPLRYRRDGRELSFFSMTAVVGAPMDITVGELALESFYPADEMTAEALRNSPRLQSDRQSGG